MNPDTFFDKFGLLADTPNGVQKLRELILQLAVQGKLVPQDPNDEPAAVLLGKIKAEKERLVKEKKIRKPKPLSSIDVENPYELPVNWKWTRIGEIGQIVGGGTPKTNNADYFAKNGIPWLTPADLYRFEGKFINRGRRDISELGLKKSSAQLMPKGTILFSSRAPIGYVAIAANDIATNQGFKSCVPFFMAMNEYIYYFLKSAGKEIDNNASGTTFKEVSGKIVSHIVFPLPPLNEQKRIVAKVDQLMALCDELEARQQNKQEARLRLNSAALDKVLTAHGPAEFANHWQRVCDNFDLLYDNPEIVGELRKAILQLAVQGRLVRQDENDEPAAVLLEKIKVEKERLVKEKMIKKINTLPLVKSEEESFKLPDGWKFIRLGEIVRKLGAGSTPKGGKAIYQNQGIKFLRSQNVWNNGLFLQNVAYIPSEIHQRMNGTFVKPGDILLNITGASIGRCAIVSDNFDEGNVSQHVTIVRLIDKALRYHMHICLISPLIQDKIMDVQVGISREGLSMSQLKEFLIPIPPFEEQRRIVAKVDQLMALCDELEAKLNQSHTDGAELMEAVVAELVGA